MWRQRCAQGSRGSAGARPCAPVGSGCGMEWGHLTQRRVPGGVWELGDAGRGSVSLALPAQVPGSCCILAPHIWPSLPKSTHKGLFWRGQRGMKEPPEKPKMQLHSPVFLALTVCRAGDGDGSGWAAPHPPLLFVTGAKFGVKLVTLTRQCSELQRCSRRSRCCSESSDGIITNVKPIN